MPDGFSATTFGVVTGGYAASRGPVTPGYTNVIPPGSSQEPAGICGLVLALLEAPCLPDPGGITFG